MDKAFKTIVLATLFLMPVFFISCIGNEEIEERTAQIEQSEISQSISRLTNAGYNVDTTDLGVYYIMRKQGTGPFPQKSDTCYLIYTGFFLDGVIFDSSIFHYPDSIWKFNFKEGNLIPGFNDGIQLLNKGAESEIIVPSSLAYGATGYGTIPPYTPLIFSLKMKDLKPKLQN